MHKPIEDWYSIPSDRHGLFRAEAVRMWSGLMTIYVTKLPIVRYTACGAWISQCGHERFVNLRAGKQYASTSDDEAVNQLKYRKRRQVQILTGRLADAEEALQLLESGNLHPGHDLFFKNYKDQ